MGSLTVRNIPEAVKQRLRIRAARNGRSMEEEIRHLLAAGEPVDASPVTASAPINADEPRPDTASHSFAGARVLLIIGGGIAAYKALDLIRRLRERGAGLRVIMTTAAQAFVTPLSAGALAGQRPFTDLFDPASEFDVGHIRLARETDLVVVAPATADLMAKMAHGLADDLASAVLLATGAPILVAPAMNPLMWNNPATRRNVARLRDDGVHFVGPNAGEMAEHGEAGTGRMAEPLEIVARAHSVFVAPFEAARATGALAGKRVLITSGPTHEPIDPVRYIANRSSGKQGHALARAAAAAGAAVTLISGPVTVPDPPGVTVVHVESARDMQAAVERALPVDVAIFAAAVADWRVAQEGRQKLKKSGAEPPRLHLVENPDILATVATRQIDRPPLVIGFAAETEHVIDHALAKLKKKRCDWIVANDVSAASGVMGGNRNTVHIVSRDGVDSWPVMSKDEVATALVARMAAALAPPT